MDENPGVKFGEISRIVAERWRGMSDADKQVSDDGCYGWDRYSVIELDMHNYRILRVLIYQYKKLALKYMALVVEA